MPPSFSPSTPKGDRIHSGLAILLALAGFTLSIAASYPGYLNGDSRHQLEEVLTGNYGDWRSPTVTLIWRALLFFFPGPVGFIVFDNLLFWGGLAALAIAIRPKLGRGALALVAIPLLPGTFNYLGHVVIDAMLAAVLVTASSLAYLARREHANPGTRLALQISANAVIALGFFVRLNAVFCLVPLLLFANGRHGLKRATLLSFAVLSLLPVLYSVQNTALDVKRSHPGDSIKVYQLLAISYHERKNLLPGTWTSEQSRQIVESCYSPIQWDTAASWGQCRFISDTLHLQGIWGTSRLTQAWISTILEHPASYFVMLVPTFKKSIFDPNSRPMLYNAANPWGWAVPDSPPRPATQLARDYATSDFNDRLGRPWFFASLSVIGLILALRHRLHTTTEGQFGVAVLLSGLVYLATFFFFNVSAEFRYFYWSGFSAYCGLGVVLLAYGRHRRNSTPMIKPSRAHTWIHQGSLLLATFVTSLHLLPFDLLPSKRLISLTPLDKKVVGVSSVALHSTPVWMRKPFEAGISAMTWAHVDGVFRSTPRLSPLVIQTNTLHQDLIVHFETGPDRARVAIDEAGRHLEIDTHAPETGNMAVLLSPLDRSDQRKQRFNRESILLTILVLAGAWLVIRKLARPRGLLPT